MTAYNVVRMRVKPDRNEDYLEAHRAIGRDTFRHEVGRNHPDMKVEDGKVAAFRTRVPLSFKYEA